MGRLTDEAKRHEVLVQAALTLASELSLPVVLQKIVELACEVSDARYGALGVLGAGGQISEFVTHGLSEEERARIGDLPKGHGLLGVLITEGEPLRIRRIQDHPSSSGFPPNHPPMTSFLGVPVAIRGRVFGNLYLTEKQGAEEFTEGDEDAVIKLAAQAAVAVENARLYAEAQLGQRRLTAVNDTARAILEGRDIEDVLRLIARSARELVGARIAMVQTPVEGGDSLIVRVAEGEASERLEGVRFEAEGSVPADVMRTRKPAVLIDTAVEGGANQPLVRLGGVGPALFVPLAVGTREFGTLVVANRQNERRFTDEDVDVVQAFASQAAVALEHSRIQDELKRLLLVEDRERIAKELHDDIIQSLFAEGMALQSSLAILDDRDAMELRITQSVERIDRVIRDLRNYIFALRPGATADRTVERSLREIAESFAAAGSAAVDIVVDADVASRLSGRASDLLQAAREAISNAVRHSGARRIRVSLGAAGGAALLEVADDGKGYDPGAAGGRGHGLSNLAERATALGGDLEIETVDGRGTWVRIQIPL